MSKNGLFLKNQAHKRYIMPGLISIAATGFMARFFSGRPTDFPSNVYEDTTTFEKL
jgi:hypothetical protein